MINNKVNNEDKNDEKQKKPDDKALGTAVDHFVIRDKTTDKEIINRRG